MLNSEINSYYNQLEQEDLAEQLEEEVYQIVEEALEAKLGKLEAKALMTGLNIEWEAMVKFNEERHRD